MGLLENRYTTLPLFTASTIKATGATNLVSAPTAGKSVVILDVHLNNQTTTTGFQELSLREGASGPLLYRAYAQTANQNIYQKSWRDNPWILDTATAFVAVCSVTAASSPGLEITVMYRILDRS